MMKQKENTKKGFTIIELVIIIGLLMVIVGIFSVNFVKNLNKQKEEESKRITSQIVSAANAYVSMNPESIERLYNSYGYVYIPVGTLRDNGFLSEKIENTETGENISDDELVKVRLDVIGNLEYTYPATKTNDEPWILTAEKITLFADKSGADWCQSSNNKMLGLIDKSVSDYIKIESKLYLMKGTGDEEGKMYDGSYGEDGIDLKATSCNVNIKKPGEYNITYQYKDPDHGIQKTANRLVVVEGDRKDVMSFTGEFLGNIYKYMRYNEVSLKIIETLRDGTTNTLTSKVSELGQHGYELNNFTTVNKVSNKDALLTKVAQNSDDSLPNPVSKNVKYSVLEYEYTLSYNANGGTVSPTSKTVVYNNPYGTLPSPTRDGYTFNGWFTHPSSGTRITASSIYNIKGNTTIYAHWTAKTMTLSFNSMGGTSFSNRTYTAPTTSTKYNSVGSLPSPTRTGYSFLGWYTSSSGGTRIYDSSNLYYTTSHTLYARWSANSYLLWYNANGGSVSPSYKWVNYGSSYGALPTPTRSGYSFEGWYTASSGGSRVYSSTTFNSTSTVNIYAHWKQNGYYLYLYDYYPPSGSYSQYTYYGPYTNSYTSYSGRLPSLSNKGSYTFDGWYTGSRCSGTKVSTSGSFSRTSGNYLYACYKEAKWEIWYDSDNFTSFSNPNSGQPCEYKNASYSTLVCYVPPNARHCTIDPYIRYYSFSYWQDYNRNPVPSCFNFTSSRFTSGYGNVMRISPVMYGY